MENLAPLIFFALIALLQLLVRWVRTRQQRQQPPSSPPASGPAVELPRLPSSPSEIPSVSRLPTRAPRALINDRVPDDEELLVRTPARPASSALLPRRAAHHLRPRLGSRAEVMRAIVLMEILGPPRSATDLERRGPR